MCFFHPSGRLRFEANPHVSPITAPATSPTAGSTWVTGKVNHPTTPPITAHNRHLPLFLLCSLCASEHRGIVTSVFSYSTLPFKPPRLTSRYIGILSSHPGIANCPLNQHVTP